MNSRVPSLAIDGIIIQVIPSDEHEYTLSTFAVAAGYGVSESTIKEHKRQHADELVSGKHFLEVRNPDFQPGKGGSHTNIHWTKRGIVRLGFFIRSERAKRFRDMAEDLVVGKWNEEGRSMPVPVSARRDLPEILLDKIDTFVLGTSGTYADFERLIRLQRESAGLPYLLPHRDEGLVEEEELNALVRALLDTRSASRREPVEFSIEYVLDAIYHFGLVQWIFPGTGAATDWRRNRAIQSRLGKYLRKRVYGREFETNKGTYRAHRGPAARKASVIFVPKTGRAQ